MYDEPLAAAEVARGHFNRCAACQGRFAEIAAAARSAQGALSAPAVTVDPNAAYRAVAPRLERPRPAWLPRPWFGRAPARRAAGLAAVMAAAVAALAFGPTLADPLVQVFSPRQVTTVPITAQSLQGFPDLSSWGTVKVTAQPELEPVDGAQQAAGGDLPLLSIKAPAGLPAAQYARVSGAAGTFTFDAAKAEAAAQSKGAKAPPLPANLNGSALQLTGGPAELAIFGSLDPSQVRSGQMPQLVVAVGRKPAITSNGATVQQIENAVLAQPGVSPELAAEIRAIGDPTSTLPIPIPADRAASHPVTLADGTPATFIGDNTGVAAGIVWVRGDYVYAVGGSLHEADLMAVANSLG